MKKIILLTILFIAEGLYVKVLGQTHQIEYNISGNLGNDNLKVSSFDGNLGNSGVHLGTLASGNDIEANAPFIATTFNSTPTSKLLKATAGKPFSVALSFTFDISPSTTVFINNTNSDSQTLTGRIGKNEQVNPYDQIITLNRSISGSNSVQRGITYGGEFTFPIGRTQGWLVFGFTINRTLNGAALPPQNYTVVLPYVVEGINIDLSVPNAVARLGTFREPAVPHMILHNPPGDLSSATFEETTNTCREISQSLANSESTSANLKLTLGIAGSAGLFVTTNFEFSASVSGGGGFGESTIRSNGSQSCLTVQRSISTQPGSPANEGSIYMGYSSEIAYGLYPVVTIKPGPTISVVKDSALIFAAVPNSAVDFYYTKADILEDMRVKQQIADNTPSDNIRLPALAQVNVWRQVLRNDSLNIYNPSNELLNGGINGTGVIFTGNQGPNPFSATTTISNSETIEVSNFIEGSFGASFVAKFGGSGVEGGFEFKTNRTMGRTVNVNSSSALAVSYNLQDDNAGDVFKVKIVKDPTYGTPIFLLDSASSKTSAPYEGGYPRDQPSLEFSAAPTSSRYTIPNVPVGAKAEFGVKICNKSNEPRTYYFGFDPDTNPNSTSITFSAPPQGAKYGPFNVPANSCNSATYFGSIEQTISGALTSKEIKLQLYPDLEPNISSDLFVTANWGNYALPSNLTSSNNVVCPGSDVTLSAFCPAGVVTWYNSAIAETPLATGSSITQTPIANTDYFVSCQAGIYNYERVKASSVSVPSFVFPTLNLTSDIRTNSLQLANTNLLASNKIFSPANVSYLAGNSLTFEPGFEVSSGGIFEAKIGGCANLLINGLVAYYPFNGNANDESTNNNNGVVNGATLTTDRFGNPDKAYSFDGVDDRINANVGAEMYSAEKTISVWAMVSGAGSVNPRLVGVGPYGASQQHYAMLLEGETSPRRLWFFTSYIVTNAFSTTLIPNSAQWNHYTITIKENIAKIYINGTLDSETTLTGALTNFTSALLQIGYSDNGLDWFNGKLDDIRIYNRGLSDAEVTAIYNAEKP